MEQHKTKSTLTGEIVFLMLALVMGLIYFNVVIIGLSLAAGTLVIWIGLPILFATLYAVHGMAEVERRMVSNLLGMPHSELPYGSVTVEGFLRRLGGLLRDPYTWTGMLYMLFIKLPLGIISFTLVLTFSLLSLTLTFLPLVYLLNLFVDAILIKNGVPPGQSILIPYFVEIHGSFNPLAFANSFAAVPLGLVLSFMTRQMIRGLASFSGLLAHAMLGPGSTAYPMQPHTPTYAPSLRMQEQQHVYVE
jgi:hypothetical protein